MNSIGPKTLEEFNRGIDPNIVLTNRVPWLGIQFRDQLVDPSINSITRLLDLAAVELTEAIQHAAKASILYTRQGPSPKV